MLLQEIFDQLSSGEFSQLSIGGQSAGTINSANWDKVAGHVNLGLTALYKRFNLKEGTLALQMQAGLLTYKLLSPYAVNAVGSTQPVRYIIDTAGAPFLDDIIKVEKVFGTVKDFYGELSLNDAVDDMSVTTPSALKLQLPAKLDTQLLSVVYRANHPKIVTSGGAFSPSTTEIELPGSHLEALLYYVASRVHNPVGMTNEFHAGNSYFAKYEAACQTLEGEGLEVDLTQTNTRLRRNGWA